MLDQLPPISPLLVVIAFSSLNEAIIEYMFGNVKALHPYLPLLSLATAIFLTFTYNISVFALIFGVESNSPFLDFLLTGFIVARLSNFINDLAQRLLRSK